MKDSNFERRRLGKQRNNEKLLKKKPTFLRAESFSLESFERIIRGVLSFRPEEIKRIQGKKMNTNEGILVFWRGMEGVGVW